jgi:hypothetical protein
MMGKLTVRVSRTVIARLAFGVLLLRKSLREENNHQLHQLSFAFRMWRREIDYQLSIERRLETTRYRAIYEQQSYVQTLLESHEKELSVINNQNEVLIATLVNLKDAKDTEIHQRDTAWGAQVEEMQRDLMDSSARLKQQEREIAALKMKVDEGKPVGCEPYHCLGIVNLACGLLRPDAEEVGRVRRGDGRVPLRGERRYACERRRCRGC